MAVSIRRLSGDQIKPYLDDLARLRIEVFRHFPYLYDGDMDYERKYLDTYARSPESLFVLALDGETLCQYQLDPQVLTQALKANSVA